MGTNQPYLKGKNVWWLRLFIGVNIAAFHSIAIGHQLTAASIDQFWQRLSAEDGLLALCLLLVTIVLNGILGDRLLGRRVHKGHRVEPGDSVLCRAVGSICDCCHLVRRMPIDKHWPIMANPAGTRTGTSSKSETLSNPRFCAGQFARRYQVLALSLTAKRSNS